MRCLTSGMARTFCSAAFIASTTPPGVPAGAKMPFQEVTSKVLSSPSCTVGTSGRAGERAVPVVAMARARPSSTADFTAA